MSKEKLVKQQAREAMKGNNVPIILSMMVFSIVLILAENIMYWFWIYFDAIDLEIEKMNAGSDLPYYSVLAGTVILVAALSPFFNGMYKTAANAVVSQNNKFTDALYFFGSARRYFKTLIINMSLFIIFFAPVQFLQNAADSAFSESGDWYPVVSAIVFVIIRFFLYALFVHYPLCLYALDDSKGAAKYIFGYIGFSSRHFGAFFKLFFSMIGWIALCFFVAPLLYTGPYFLTASINSARWLLKTDEEKSRKMYQPQPAYDGYNGFGG